MKPAVLALLIVAGAAPATAQTGQTPESVLSFLVTNQAVQTGDFQKDAAAAAATRDTIERALLANLAAAPVATSSSGFAYRFDPEVGAPTRQSDSFGTFFVERAFTTGKRRYALGASASAADYTSLDGRSLSDGTLVTTANQFRDESAPFDVETLTLKISTRTVTVFGSYGVTDRLEIGGAVPFVQLHLEGSRVNVYRGQTFVQASGSADASGAADAAIRAKYQLVSRARTAVSAAGEVRLPTGSQEALLGAGSASIRVTGIASFEGTRAGAHVNVALQRGGASAEFDASGAVTYSIAPRVTAAGELLLRRLSDVPSIVAVTSPHPTIAGVDTLRLVPGTDVPTWTSAVSGVKWNATSTLVISGQVLWQLGSGGLTGRPVPIVSADYLF